jgi:uncharacterized membrane protein SpoIIM required for sporulation
MRQQDFEDRYGEEWTRFEKTLIYLEKKGGWRNGAVGEKLKNEVDVCKFPETYRRICHYLALARERHYSTLLTDKLNSLVLRGHQQLYQRKSDLKAAIIEFIVSGFPSAVRAEWRFCLAAAMVFILPGLLLWGVTMTYPEAVYSVFDPAQVNAFESMYDPAKRVIGKTRDSDSDFAMFGHYIQNNIGIGFQIFAGGILFCLGSLFFLVYNGIIFGALSGHIINIHFNETFFSFVVGHGSFELTAIVLSGAAGLKLGYAIISPGRHGRGQALRLAAASAIKIIYGVIVMLLVAAFIEAFWSSSTLVSVNLKYMVGAGLWFFIFYYFCFMGRRRAV